MGELREYKKGDIVTCDFLGDRVFLLEDYPNSDLPLAISISRLEGYGEKIMFTRDGRILTYATQGSLNLVSRPKKKVKKEFRKVIFRHKNGKVYETNKPYESKEAFEAMSRELALGNLLMGGAYSFGDSASEEEIQKHVSKFLYFNTDQEPLIIEVEE